jgi:accessory gene regulator B
VSLYNISNIIGKYITKEAGFGPGYADRVRYGTEIILGALIKGIVLFTAAGFWNILPQVIVAFSCGSLLRLVSGGAHCTGYLRCLGFGLLVYLSIGKVALYLERFISPDQLAPILLSGFLIMTLCALLWAPAQVPYRPINFNEAIFFKSLTITILAVCLTIAFLFSNQIKMSFMMAGLLSLLAQTFSFSPPGYLVIGKIDTFLLNITSKKGGVPDNAEN